MLLVGIICRNGNGHRLELVDDGELLVKFEFGSLTGKNVQVITVVYVLVQT